MCDGVTNDTVALNAQLQSAAGSGATLLLPGGNLRGRRRDHHVHVPSNVTLRGQGTGSTGTRLLAAPQVTKCASNPGSITAR